MDNKPEELNKIFKETIIVSKLKSSFVKLEPDLAKTRSSIVQDNLQLFSKPTIKDSAELYVFGLSKQNDTTINPSRSLR